MRIGIFVESYKAGGVNTVIVNQINHWPKDDEIVLIVNKNHVGFKRVISKKVTRPLEVETIPFETITDLYQSFSRFVPMILIRACFYFGRYAYAIMSYFKLKIFLKSLGLDAIFIHNGGYPGAPLARYAAIAAKNAGVPTVSMVVHNIAMPVPVLQYPFERLIDILVDKSVCLVGVSNAVKESVKNHRYFKQDVVVIYSGLSDIKGCEIPANPSEMISRIQQLSEHKNIIVSLSTFEVRKGHEYLLEALHLLRKNDQFSDFFYIIAGIGALAEKRRLENLVKKFQLNDCVIFTGFIENVSEFLAYADLLVFPSTTQESFGLTILEAALHSVPVIASDIPGVNETLVHEHSALFVPPAAPEALANAMLRLFSDPDLVEKFKVNAKALVLKKFNARRMCLKYHDLIFKNEELAMKQEKHVVVRTKYSHKMEVNPADLIGKQVMNYGVWDSVGMLAIKAVLSTIKDPVSFDIGANIGTHTLCMSEYSKSVYAFEPQKATFGVLSRNIQMNNISNCELANIGLSNRACTADIYINNELNNGMTTLCVDLKKDSCQSEPVSLLVGDKYSADNGIGRLDFIKVDVEGHEGESLLGLKGMIDKYQPVVMFEWNNKVTKQLFKKENLFHTMFMKYNVSVVTSNHLIFLASLTVFPVLKYKCLFQVRRVIYKCYRLLVREKVHLTRFEEGEDYDNVLLYPSKSQERIASTFVTQ